VRPDGSNGGSNGNGGGSGGGAKSAAVAFSDEYARGLADGLASRKGASLSAGHPPSALPTPAAAAANAAACLLPASGHASVRPGSRGDVPPFFALAPAAVARSQPTKAAAVLQRRQLRAARRAAELGASRSAPSPKAAKQTAVAPEPAVPPQPQPPPRRRADAPSALAAAPGPALRASALHEAATVEGGFARSRVGFGDGFSDGFSAGAVRTFSRGGDGSGTGEGAATDAGTGWFASSGPLATLRRGFEGTIPTGSGGGRTVQPALQPVGSVRLKSPTKADAASFAPTHRAAALLSARPTTSGGDQQDQRVKDALKARLEKHVRAEKAHAAATFQGLRIVSHEARAGAAGPASTRPRSANPWQRSSEVWAHSTEAPPQARTAWATRNKVVSYVHKTTK
jgi:hypothetical protein